MAYFDGHTKPGYLGRALEAEELAKRRNPFARGERVRVPGGGVGIVMLVEGFSCIVDTGKAPFERFHSLSLKRAA